MPTSIIRAQFGLRLRPERAALWSGSRCGMSRREGSSARLGQRLPARARKNKLPTIFSGSKRSWKAVKFQPVKASPEAARSDIMKALCWYGKHDVRVENV